MVIICRTVFPAYAIEIKRKITILNLLVKNIIHLPQYWRIIT